MSRPGVAALAIGISCAAPPCRAPPRPRSDVVHLCVEGAKVPVDRLWPAEALLLNLWELHQYAISELRRYKSCSLSCGSTIWFIWSMVGWKFSLTRIKVLLLYGQLAYCTMASMCACGLYCAIPLAVPHPWYSAVHLYISCDPAKILTPFSAPRSLHLLRPLRTVSFRALARQFVSDGRRAASDTEGSARGEEDRRCHALLERVGEGGRE